jgi:hypothetical protein
MALQKVLSLANNFGEQSQIDCYIRVVEVSTAKSQGVVKLDIMRADQTRILEKRDMVFVPNLEPGAQHPWAQAYEHLKTLPEYAGAIDC